ncbi:MAG: LCP family protein [Lachnospiraceae bacterium]|nr:LCP family protein [Lachnospiraceae bacterium]
MANKEVTKKKKKKQSKSVTILTVLLIILAVLIALAAFILTRSKPEEPVDPDFDITLEEETDDMGENVPDDAPTIDESKAGETIDLAGETEDDDYVKDEGWIHYLLLGVDGVTDSYKSKRSDAMIVLSVNKDENRVVLSSVPRDTLVYVDGKGFDKLTHAYAYGGAALTVKAYEDNFDIDIDSYITVNFAAMEEIVDLLGGLTLTLTDAEAKHMGDYYAAWGLSGGTQKLNGKEVLAYCRVRKIDSDFKRTERQYKVLMEMYKAVKDLSPAKYGALITTAYDHINTDMIVADVIGLAGNLLGILDTGAEIEHVSLVDSQYCKTGRLDGSSVVMVDNLVKTAERWRAALGIEGYKPSSRLEKISKQLDATIGR